MTDPRPLTEPGAYTLATREMDRLISKTQECDPFIVHRIRPRGWRVVRDVLLRRYELTVTIDADRALVERVLELNPDYLGPPGSPSRNAWNMRLQAALVNLGDCDLRGDL